MNCICEEERNGRVAIKESFGLDTIGSSLVFLDGENSSILLTTNSFLSCERTSREFGQFPPLRFVKDRALSFESSSGK